MTTLDNKDRDIRIKNCKELLTKIIMEGSPRSTPEFLQSCQKWHRMLSVMNVPIEVIEKCEKVLGRKLCEVDEIEQKIMEIQCKWREVDGINL